MKRSSRQIGFLVPAALMLLALPACQKTPEVQVEEQPGEIAFEVTDSWQSMPDTRATLYENTAALISDANLRFYAFEDGTTDKYLSNIRVRYFDSQWRTLGDNDLTKKYFWPPDGTSLNFFAFMPYDGTGAGYCSFDPEPYNNSTNTDGYADNAPKLSCTGLPVTSATQASIREYIFAYAMDLNKDNVPVSGVPLNFVHPFAAVYFNLSQALQGLTLNSVSITGIYNNGIGTFQNSTPWINWATSGETTNLVVSINKTMGGTGESALPVGALAGPFIVLPQTFAGSTQTIVVNATYSDWTADDGQPANTKNLSVNITLARWEPGKKYTYTLDLGKDNDNVILRAEVQAWGNQGSYTSTDVE